MNNVYASEIIYIGFLLPSLFSITLIIEGLYKITKHEEGAFTFFMGLFFILGLIVSYIFLFKR